MRTINEREHTPQHLAQNVLVVDFWERVYLPYCEKEWKGTGMRSSTLPGYIELVSGLLIVMERIAVAER